MKGENIMMFVDYAPCKECKNPDTFGMTCVKCGYCGRKFNASGICQNINDFPSEEESSGYCTVCGKELTNANEKRNCTCEKCMKMMEEAFNNFKKYCSNCGAELTNTEKKYYECFCEKCEKKLTEERDKLEENEAKRQAMVDAAYKHLEEVTKKPLNFER